jgi:hypothetical protein
VTSREGKQPTNPPETRAERRQRLRKEYHAALAEFRSFHPNNVTPAYYRARQRLYDADKARAACWRR